MPDYDARSFDPPAPIAEVTVCLPGSDDIVPNVNMLIDTGADVSLLPRSPIAHLIEELDVVGEYEIEGFNGARSVAPAVQMELRFLGRIFRGRFLVTEQEIGILGRNILNSLPLLFDGPNLVWDVHRQA